MSDLLSASRPTVFRFKSYMVHHSFFIRRKIYASRTGCTDTELNRPWGTSEHGPLERSEMNTSPRKKIWIGLSILALAAIAAAILIRRPIKQSPLAIGVPISGGAAMERRIAAPLFKQWNPAWSKQMLGATEFPIATTGCTVCCVAMALSSKGVPFDPAKLNGQLTARQAFTATGLLIWSGVSGVTNGSVKVRLDDHPSFESIDAQLSAGNPVLAKVLYDNRVWHWVLITGKSASEYLMHDPLSPGPEYERMTAYPQGIFAIRYLEKR